MTCDPPQTPPHQPQHRPPHQPPGNPAATAHTDWPALWALLDQADALPPDAHAAWLAGLQAQGHPQAQALRRLLDMPDSFLDRLPRLGSTTPAALHGPAQEGQADPGQADDGQARAGQAIGGYRLLRPLGSGGMAEVWLAERADGAFVRQVALKLLFLQGTAQRQRGLRQRFVREHHILAGLRHPHIAALHDAGVSAGGQPWLALEYVDGQPIDTWCDQQQLGLRPRVRLFGQVLQAVAHAHARLVLHRDLKPSNVLVTPGGEVRLLDFGIATLLASDGGCHDDTALTQAGGRPMTPRYASPEQLQGLPLAVTSDVYALGLVLYALLCGQPPHPPGRAGSGALERAILADDPPAPSRQPGSAAALAARGLSAPALRRQLSGELDAIVLRAVARQPEARYPTVDALAADLAHWLAGEPVQARLPGPTARAWKFSRRHPWGTGLGSAAVLALALATALATHNASQARAQAARAQAASDFMLRLFEDTDPDRHGGQPPSPAQLLQRGHQQLAASTGTPPALQADLLAGLGKALAEMGDFDKADAPLARRVALCQQHCSTAQQADALTRLAENHLRRRQLADATRTLAQADAAQPEAQALPALRAKRHEVRGWLAFASQQQTAAEQAFGQGLQALGQNPQALGGTAAAASRQSVDLWLGLAEARARRGDASAAMAALDAAAQANPAVLAERPTIAHEVAMVRAGVLDSLAQYGRVLAEVPPDLQRCSRAMGPGAESCRKLRTIVWRAQWRLGLASQVWADWPAVLQVVDGQGPEVEQCNALQLANRVAWQTGSSAARTHIAQRLATLEHTSAWAPVQARAALALAETALAQRHSAAARQHLARARAAAGDPARADVFLQAQLDLVDGLAALQDGDTAASIGLLATAQAKLDTALGPRHPLALWLGLNRVQALWASGQAAQAQALVADALAVLQHSLGPQTPALQRVQALQRQVAVAPPGAPPANPLTDAAPPYL